MPCSTNTIVQYLDKKLSLPTHKTVQRVHFEMLDELYLNVKLPKLQHQSCPQYLHEGLR